MLSILPASLILPAELRQSSFQSPAIPNAIVIGVSDGAPGPKAPRLFGDSARTNILANPYRFDVPPHGKAKIERMIRQRILLSVLLAWALVIIVPDVLRVVQPLASFGFHADSYGLIYDVTGPFDEKEQSPAWNAAIRTGDWLALKEPLLLISRLHEGATRLLF